MGKTVFTWPQLNIRSCSYQFNILDISSCSYQSYSVIVLILLCLAAPFLQPQAVFVWHIAHFCQDNKKLLEKWILCSSQLDVVYNKHILYVCSAGDLMLLAVDQKYRALERTCSPYILKLIALQFNNTLHLITALDNYYSKTTPGSGIYSIYHCMKLINM